ncbi:hypothetical protein C8Q77DRAFT_888111 [Trametes polyzona]|nr:hypothetical protein C8Q77DRAFT_888111 [Trametes polyzona]
MARPDGPVRLALRVRQVRIRIGRCVCPSRETRKTREGHSSSHAPPACVPLTAALINSKERPRVRAPRQDAPGEDERPRAAGRVHTSESMNRPRPALEGRGEEREEERSSLNAARRAWGPDVCKISLLPPWRPGPVRRGGRLLRGAAVSSVGGSEKRKFAASARSGAGSVMGFLWDVKICCGREVVGGSMWFISNMIEYISIRCRMDISRVSTGLCAC